VLRTAAEVLEVAIGKKCNQKETEVGCGRCMACGGGIRSNKDVGVVLRENYFMKNPGTVEKID
jgi:hypothetical protein